MEKNTLAGRTILQIIPQLDIGGAESVVADLAPAVAAAGARSLVVSNGGRLVGHIEALGCEAINLPVHSKNPFTIYANIARLARLMVAERVSLIHAHSRAPAWSAFYAARRVGIPYLASYHRQVAATPRLKLFYDSVLTRGALVLANSHFTATALRRVHGVGAARLRVIAPGCNPQALARAQVTKTARAEQRAAWGVPQQAFLIICPARLTALKGQAVLLAALARLKSSLRPWLVLAGDARGRKAYLAELQAAARPLGGRVIFAGRVDNMQRAYAAANLAVLPSIMAEPFGLGCIEAQAASLPVIASDAGGFRETVLAGKSGWLVPPNKAAALARALDAALALSPQDLTAMGKAGRAHVAANFTSAQMHAKTLAAYAEVLAA